MSHFKHSTVMLGALLLAAPVFVDPQAAALAQAAEGSVARAVFTTGVENREPVDEISSAPASTQTIYFFTELRDLQGHKVTHRWTYNGTVMAEIDFDVGGARWRVYSSKNFVPQWVGEWAVEVVDESGNVLETRALSFGRQ